MNEYPTWRSSAPDPKTIGVSFSEYRRDPRLETLINGKRIAFVCPGEHLVECGYDQDTIDDYDIVIRVGMIGDISQSLWRSIGSRTDVLIHSFNEPEMDCAEKNLDYLRRLKFVLCPMVSASSKGRHNQFFGLLHAAGITCQKVEDDYLYGKFSEIGTTPNVGLLGLLTILEYPVKQVYVTGMNFYNFGQYGKVYNHQYYDLVTKDIGLYSADEGNTTPANARADLHDQDSQIAFFKKLCARDDRIIPDDYLSRRLQIKPL